MRAILDTGPWVALIDRSEAKHEQSIDWLRSFSGEFYTTEAVLTEVLYLLNFSVKAQSAALDFLLKSVANLVPPSRESLSKSKKLMTKYADLPMDYADATIVSLALETGVDNVVTFDKRDFSIYRLTKRQSFNIFP